MGRAPLEGRNGQIWLAYISGKHQEAIAAEFGISQQRVSLICKNVKEKIPQADREELIVREVDLLNDLRVRLFEQAKSAPPPAYHKDGTIKKDEDGNTVYDYSGIYAAIDRIMSAHDRFTKLLGLASPVEHKHSLVIEEATEAAKAAAADAAQYLNGEKEE